MFFLISLVLAALFIGACSRPLKRHPAPFYAAAAVIALAVFGCTVGRISFPAWFQNWIWPLFSRSAFATALFAVVMCTGALPNGSKPMRYLMPIRGQLSILACILTLGHNASYGMTYFRFLFTRPSRLPATQLAAAVCSLILIAIMLPLFITSFQFVRRKMSGKSWKRLQRLAYIFYALLYVHIMLLNIPLALAGRSGYLLNVLVYSIVFLGYGACRVMKALSLKVKRTDGLPQRQCAALAGALAISLCLSGILGFSVTAKPAELADMSLQQTELAANSENPDSSPSPPASPSPSADLNTPAPDVSPEQSADQDQTEDLPEQPADQTEAPPEQPADQTPEQPSNAPSQEPAAPSAAIEPPVQEETTTETPAQDPEPEPSSSPTPEPEPEPVRIYQNGTFSGRGQGYSGWIMVSVTIQDDVITGITVTSTMDDADYFSDAEAVIGRILAAQNTNVDTVSGATYSSEGIIDAVAAALKSAKN